MKINVKKSEIILFLMVIRYSKTIPFKYSLIFFIISGFPQKSKLKQDTSLTRKRNRNSSPSIQQRDFFPSTIDPGRALDRRRRVYKAS